MIRKGFGWVLAAASVLTMGTMGCEADDSSSAGAPTADTDAGPAPSDDAGTATASAHAAVGTAGHCVSLGATIQDLPGCDPLGGRARGAAFTSMLPLLGASSLDDTGMVTTPLADTLSETSAGVKGVVTTGAINVSAVSSFDGAHASTSVANVGLSVVAAALGLGVSAVSATADSICGVGTGTASIAGLTLNGKSVAVTGAANQTVTVPGGLVKLVLNEQVAAGPGGITVNAIHLSALSGTLLGLDVIIASATAQAKSACGCTAPVYDGGLLDLDAGGLLRCSSDSDAEACPEGMFCLPE